MTSSTTPSPASLATVPRAVWVAFGTLALATAGLAGALLARPAPAVATAAPQDVATAQQAPTAVAPVAQFRAQEAAPGAPQRRVAPSPDRMAQAPAPAAAEPLPTTRAAVCATCGTVEAVRALQVQGQGSGLGAVAGGVVGGLVGNQFGGGNGKAALTVLGAVGGGVAGHEVEKRARATTQYDVTVRMEDGSARTLRRTSAVAVGTRVVVQGQSLRVAGDAPAPRALRTGTAA